MLTSLLHRIARRCPIHDRAAQPRIRALETELGTETSAASGDLVDQYANPVLIDCGNHWCSSKQR